MIKVHNEYGGAVTETIAVIVLNNLMTYRRVLYSYEPCYPRHSSELFKNSGASSLTFTHGILLPIAKTL